jgi:ribonuclease III
VSRSNKSAQTTPAPWLRRPLSQLLQKLGIDAADPALYDIALTHRSTSSRHNERLEFLGDAWLGFVVAEALYARFPGADEGQLTRLRASLVNREALAGIAAEIELGAWLALGDGELKSGGWRRASILGNALEALLGAVYLDLGPERARGLILQLFAERLRVASPGETLKDAKTRLQEWLQARQRPLPTYLTRAVDVEGNRQVFRVDCLVEGFEPFAGSGDSRRRAEQAAAEAAFEFLSRDAS